MLKIFFMALVVFLCSYQSNYHTKTATLRQAIGVERVKPKKHLGQHFLNAPSIAGRIADLVPHDAEFIVEIGPGMGILTEPLYTRFGTRLLCIEIDSESVEYLREEPRFKGLHVVEGDFLELEASAWAQSLTRGAVIGNYPYNISSQIVFRVLEAKEQVAFFGGMFQREVARRLCAGPGSKEYGILSVLLQNYYECSYAFTVDEGAFIPPPKVKSGVIACMRKAELPTDCRWESLKTVVKAAFNQRRKTLSNALKGTLQRVPEQWAGKRAEQLEPAAYLVLGAQLERERAAQ